MKFSELEPRWVHENLFVFRCPHCWRDGRNVFLTCITKPMSRGEIWDILVKEFGDGDCLDESRAIVVPPKAFFAWSIDQRSVFPDSLTVTPSIDASKSGHWHGSITNGEIVGGEQLA